MQPDIEFTREEVELELMAEDLSRLKAEIPFALGMEFVDSAWINHLWNELLEAEKVMMDDMPNIPVVQTGTAALQAKNVKGLVHNTVSTPYVFKYVTLK